MDPIILDGAISLGKGAARMVRFLAGTYYPIDEFGHVPLTRHQEKKLLVHERKRFRELAQAMLEAWRGLGRLAVDDLL